RVRAEAPARVTLEISLQQRLALESALRMLQRRLRRRVERRLAMLRLAVLLMRNQVGLNGPLVIVLLELDLRFHQPQLRQQVGLARGALARLAHQRLGAPELARANA